MISLPLIFREVTVAARRKRTYVMRFVFGGCLGFMVLVFLIGQMFARQSQALGQSLLTSFSWQLVILVFALAPALACGCISDEKKQGTLGLLFLTNMNSADIVLGKFFGKAFDVLLLVLSAVPLLFVPILLGGVSWEQTLGTVLNILSLLLMTLAAGVFCSAIARSTAMAVVCAYVGLVFYNVVVIVLPQLKHSTTLLSKAGFLASIPDWLALASPFYALTRDRLSDILFTLAFSGAFASVLLAYAIWCLPRHLHKQSFREPIGRVLWRRLGPTVRPSRKSPGNSRSLSRNPVLWLYFGRSKSRWVIQGIAAIVLLVAVVWVYVQEPTRIAQGGYTVAMYFGGSIGTFCLKMLILLYVARSFVTEKEDGSLELLLTTPTTNRQIVHSKLLAVMGHYGVWFLMVFGLMAAGALGMGSGAEMRAMSYYFLNGVVTTLSSVISLVLVCLWISAWAKTVMQAITFSIIGTILLGWFLGMATSIAMLVVGSMMYSTQNNAILSVPLAQISVTGVRFLIDVLIGLVAYRLLVNNLRKYATR